MTNFEITDMPWNETESQAFLEVGRIHIPARDEIGEAILDLLPAEPDESFLTVELGVGGGWLCSAILERFPASRLLGLDGSATMLRATDARLQPFAGRFDLRQFRLEDRTWLADLGNDVRCFVSSLAVHHLDGAAKRTLYRDLHDHLEDGGAALIADLVEPVTERERRYMARAWDEEVEKQSLAFTGSLHVYHQFVEGHYNWYRYPDPMDTPSTVPEHLRWLTEAGFSNATVFWERAGHAIYGGSKDR